MSDKQTNGDNIHRLGRFAHVVSTIGTTFSDGRKVRYVINTPLACAEANRLIMLGRWYVVDQSNAESEAPK